MRNARGSNEIESWGVPHPETKETKETKDGGEWGTPVARTNSSRGMHPSWKQRKPRKPRMAGNEERPRLERNRVVGCTPPGNQGDQGNQGWRGMGNARSSNELESWDAPLLSLGKGAPPPFPLLGNGHGCWIPDPGSRMLDPRSQIADVGSRIADACSQLADRSPSKGTSGTRDPGSEIRDLGSGIRDPGSGIRDLGPRIRDDLSHRCARTIAGATRIRML